MKLDDREIIRIGWEPNPNMPGDYLSVDIGIEGVTRIDAIEQNLGEYCICWLQVWKDNTLVGRFNARNIDSIKYSEESDDGNSTW